MNNKKDVFIVKVKWPGEKEYVEYGRYTSRDYARKMASFARNWDGAEKTKVLGVKKCDYEN